MQRLLSETDNGAVCGRKSSEHPAFQRIRKSVLRKKGKLGEWAACTPDSVK
jgi:hypothetical protein